MSIRRHTGHTLRPGPTLRGGIWAFRGMITEISIGKTLFFSLNDAKIVRKSLGKRPVSDKCVRNKIDTDRPDHDPHCFLFYPQENKITHSKSIKSWWIVNPMQYVNSLIISNCNTASKESSSFALLYIFLKRAVYLLSNTGLIYANLVLIHGITFFGNYRMA